MNVAPLENPLTSSPLMNGIIGVDNALSLGLGPPSIASDAIARFTAPPAAQAAGGITRRIADRIARAERVGNVQPARFDDGSTHADDADADEFARPWIGLRIRISARLRLLVSAGLRVRCAGLLAVRGEQYYASANGASQGDPHLSFNGNTWDNMTSQPNLLQSNSFQGGYNISTQVTPPSTRGISYNQSATISTNGGATTVSLNNQGQASIHVYGQNVPISPGQTVQLGNGENVTSNANGSLTVVAQNGSGGEITTTLTHSGQGVNVNVNARNVDLGGTLAIGEQMHPDALARPQPPAR